MRFLNTLIYGFMLTALLVTGVLLSGTFLPLPGSIEIKIVQSGSMAPTIDMGALVVVMPQEAYAVGDVITFGEDTKTKIPTTHRIVGKERVEGELAYITQGDANEEPDQEPVRHDEIIGGVALAIPHAGFVLDFARQPLGFMLVIGIPAALLILDELITIGREVGALRRRKTTARERAEDAQGDDGGAPRENPPDERCPPCVGLFRHAARQRAPAGAGLAGCRRKRAA